MKIRNKLMVVGALSLLSLTTLASGEDHSVWSEIFHQDQQSFTINDYDAIGMSKLMTETNRQPQDTLVIDGNNNPIYWFTDIGSIKYVSFDYGPRIPLWTCEQVPNVGHFKNTGHITVPITPDLAEEAKALHLTAEEFAREEERIENNKILLLDMVMNSYRENYSKIENPIIGMLCMGPFHNSYLNNKNNFSEKDQKLFSSKNSPIFYLGAKQNILMVSNKSTHSVNDKWTTFTSEGSFHFMNTVLIPNSDILIAIFGKPKASQGEDSK